MPVSKPRPQLVLEASPARSAAHLDLALFGKIASLISTGKAATRAEAALILAKAGRVWGYGKIENRARRLARRYRQFQAMTRAEQCRGIPRHQQSESASVEHMSTTQPTPAEPSPASAADLAALAARVDALAARVDALAVAKEGA
jgi:hypothetical protein